MKNVFHMSLAYIFQLKINLNLKKEKNHLFSNICTAWIYFGDSQLNLFRKPITEKHLLSRRERI